MMDTEELLVDFYNGARLLAIVSSWSNAVANQQVILEHMAAFEVAYERLVELHSAGKLSVGAADFSAESLALIKRINRLIQPGLSSEEVRLTAQEVHALAERFTQALTRTEAPPPEQDIDPPTGRTPLRAVADGAAWPGIERTPGVAGGDACMVRTRIPVWTLENYRRLGWTEARILDNFPTLRAADLVNAWAYVSAHQSEIDQAIRENEEA